MPNRSSNRRHSSTVSGAELEVMKRSDGRSARARAVSALSRMLIVVGLPAATVTRCSRDVLEEAAGREFLRHHQRGAAVHRHQRAEKLRGRPVERAEIVDAVVGADAEALGGRIDVAQVLAEIEHHALRLRAGAGGEQDDRIVVRPGVGRCVARFAAARPRRRTCRRAARRSARAAVAAPKPCASRSSSRKTVLVEHQLRREPRQDVVELVAVHLDVHGADGRPVGHHAEIADEMLDRVVGEQRDAVVSPSPRRCRNVAMRRGHVSQLRHS